MDEPEAIARLKRGDPGGLEFLVRHYQVLAVRTADLIVRDRSAAEDIVQTVFIRTFDRIYQFDPARPFGPWLLRCVVNDAIKAATKQARHVSLDADSADENPALADRLHDPTPSPEARLEAAQSSEQVWAALGQLSPEQRAVVVLHYFLDFSETELIDKLDRPRGTIKWRLHAARERLRELLRPLWRVEPINPDARIDD
jgi:RNA polymerase sigma-70 factor (ECF subfamily)